MKKMGVQYFPTLFLIMISLPGWIFMVGAVDLAKQCGDDVSKLAMCLSYATGKATTPSKECCSSVSDIKESEPVCLCYVIQQAHNGSAQIKSLGIQEIKLLQLPTACNLANASVSNCPKLLNIPSTSPDYAIFNSTSLTPSTTTPATSTSANDSNNGFKHGPSSSIAGPVALIALAIFFFVLPAGSASTTFNTGW